MHLRLEYLYLCLGLSLAATGCAKVKAAVCADMVPATKPGAAPATGKAPAAESGGTPVAETPSGSETNDAKHASAPTSQEQFALPFAWERSPTEPLSRTRAYLRDMARDNAQYMRRGPEFFKSFANVENPRATIVSCADSRVQSPAFDLTPENDDYTVRNLGNQVVTGLGAVQYGVEALETPLLVVLGHTGCGAVKTAMTGSPKLAEPIRKELATLKVAPYRAKKPLDDKLWAAAVLANVNNQVESALSTFAARVNAGQLTVIGAVYDLRNDLQSGAGKVSIVNVNGVTDGARLKAFHDAVLVGASYDTRSGSGKHVDPFERLSQVFAEHMSDEEDGSDIERDDLPDPAPVSPAVPPAGAAAKQPPTGTMPASKAARH
jgi:carbonic anhydrase